MGDCPDLVEMQLEKFLAFKQRGALFANADFRPWKTPDEPGFDWMTFQEVQNVGIVPHPSEVEADVAMPRHSI